MRALKFILFLSTSLFFVKAQAQAVGPLKVQEYGIGLNNLNSFSLQYRWGNEKRLYRIAGVFGANSNFSNQNTKIDYNDTNRTNYNRTVKGQSAPLNLNLGFNFSVLHIKSVSEKFGFVYGPLLGVSGGFSRTVNQFTNIGIGVGGPVYAGTQTTTQLSVLPYAGVVLGMMYKISPSFILYAEVGPNLYYNFTQSNYKATASSDPKITEEGTLSSHGFGLSGISNSGMMLTLVYRITKSS